MAKQAQALLQGVWYPIEIYDSLSIKDKPKLCVFRFKPTEPAPHRTDFLAECFAMTRFYGHRDCTDFMILPLIHSGME